MYYTRMRIKNDAYTAVIEDKLYIASGLSCDRSLSPIGNEDQVAVGLEMIHAV